MAIHNKADINLLIVSMRIIMVLAFGSLALVIGTVWVQAMFGETQPIFELLDWPEKAGPLSLWKIIIGVVMSGFTLASIGIMFWAVHRFFAKFSAGQYFAIETVRLIRRASICMMCFWFGLMAMESLLPFILTIGYPASQQVPPEMFPFDLEIIFLIVGAAFYVVSKLLEAAHSLDEDNKQIV